MLTLISKEIGYLDLISLSSATEHTKIYPDVTARNIRKQASYG